LDMVPCPLVVHSMCPWLIYDITADIHSFVNFSGEVPTDEESFRVSGIFFLRDGFVANCRLAAGSYL
jgi:hypothetical protein